ncbi:Clp protease [Frankia sp. CNm7]|uniref:Clp R domain-containing protein n=1 Tax=Frankia nepalensis TaxID=1836974 RepID=A0A937RLH3_9ACTN|nr:Clp protease N-terminal domain-containing protein [Frankia nepalensis]MBL7499929.1 Clp protease [Frankia nepalensis]MBL7511708.1 Clp protease [Frankia nepalensis]MBL7523035.1 Clp protease [Frankia nepalensis]MBL7632532.1 hypothetical protein [Frankia nepalensis]
MKLTRTIKDIPTLRTLLEGAEAEARDAGRAEPGAEHLLLAALALPEGSAPRVLAHLDPTVDLARVRAAIAAQHAAALEAVGIEVPGPLAADAPGEADLPVPPTYRADASAREAFRAVTELVRAKPRVPLCGAHVVAAVAGLEHGTTPRALRILGIDREALAAAARAELARLAAAGRDRRSA